MAAEKTRVPGEKSSCRQGGPTVWDLKTYPFDENFEFYHFWKKYKDFRNNSFLKVGEGPFKYTIMQILTLGHDT